MNAGIASNGHFGDVPGFAVGKIGILFRYFFSVILFRIQITEIAC